jgi:hypothetical protein
VAELLSAAALLLTAITVIYTVWNGEVRTALAIPPPDDVRNALPAIHTVRTTRHQRATPLMVIAILDVLVFAPPSIGLLSTSVTLLVTREGRYDPVVASLLVIWLFTIVLASVLVQEFLRLRRRERELADPQMYIR